MRDLVDTLAREAELFETGRQAEPTAEAFEAELVKAERQAEAAEIIQSEAPSLPDYFLTQA